MISEIKPCAGGRDMTQHNQRLEKPQETVTLLVTFTIRFEKQLEILKQCKRLHYFDVKIRNK